MADLVDLLLRVAVALDSSRLPFILIGGVAVSSWVEPRLTQDVDIVVRGRRRDAARVKGALLNAGARATALEMRWLFEKRFVRLQVNGGRLDVRVAVTAHDDAAFTNAVMLRYQGRSVRVAVPEDLILYKLEAWRLQDRLDVINLLKGVRDLNRRYVESWLDPIAGDTGTPMRARWAQILAEAS